MFYPLLGLFKNSVTDSNENIIEMIVQCADVAKLGKIEIY